MIGGNGEVVVAFSIRESQDWRIAVQAGLLAAILYRSILLAPPAAGLR